MEAYRDGSDTLLRGNVAKSQRCHWNEIQGPSDQEGGHVHLKRNQRDEYEKIVKWKK